MFVAVISLWLVGASWFLAADAAGGRWIAAGADGSRRRHVSENGTACCTGLKWQAPYQGNAQAEAAILDGVAYVATSNCSVVALDLQSGELLGAYTQPTDVYTECGTPILIPSSPLLYLPAYASPEFKVAILAIDRTQLTLNWTYGDLYASNEIFGNWYAANNESVFTFDGKFTMRLTALSPDNGTVRWARQLDSDVDGVWQWNMALSSDGQWAFVAANSGFFIMKPVIYVVDTREGKTVRKIRPSKSGWVLEHDGVLLHRRFFTNLSGTFSEVDAYDFTTGNMVWSHACSGPNGRRREEMRLGDAMLGNPNVAAANGFVYLLCPSGVAKLAAASGTLVELLDVDTSGVFVLTDDAIVTFGEQLVSSWSLSTGALIANVTHVAATSWFTLSYASGVGFLVGPNSVLAYS